MAKRFLFVLPLVLALALFAGCNAASDEDPRTETIEPALVPADTSGDAIITQTTEVGEERSPNEGGVLTRPGPTTTGSPPPAGAQPEPPPQSKRPPG
ncbi:MAG: hypothetical protein ACRD2J_16460 [Thermoanaerobaculia bacterium]